MVSRYTVLLKNSGLKPTQAQEPKSAATSLLSDPRKVWKCGLLSTLNQGFLLISRFSWMLCPFFLFCCISMWLCNKISLFSFCYCFNLKKKRDRLAYWAFPIATTTKIKTKHLVFLFLVTGWCNERHIRHGSRSLQQKLHK